MRVDVGLGLGQDHATLALVLEGFRGVHRHARRSRLIEDHSIERTGVELGDRDALAAAANLALGTRHQLWLLGSVVEHGLAAGHLADGEACVGDAAADPVDRRNRHARIVAGIDQSLDVPVCLLDRGRKALERDLVMAGLLLASLLVGHPERALQVALQHGAEVDI